jgi:hypothetical protein
MRVGVPQVERPILVVVAGMAVAALATVLMFTGAAAGAAKAVPDPLELHTHKYFPVVCVASLVGWMLGLGKGFSTSADWLRRYSRKPHRLVVGIVDFFVFVVAGAYIGTGIFMPETFVSAAAAGLTWPVAFGALTTREGRTAQGAGTAAKQAAKKSAKKAAKQAAKKTAKKAAKQAAKRSAKKSAKKAAKKTA